MRSKIDEWEEEEELHIHGCLSGGHMPDDGTYSMRLERERGRHTKNKSAQVRTALKRRVEGIPEELMRIMMITHCDELCLNIWKWQSIIQAISSISFPIHSLIHSCTPTMCDERQNNSHSAGCRLWQSQSIKWKDRCSHYYITHSHNLVVQRRIQITKIMLMMKRKKSGE